MQKRPSPEYVTKLTALHKVWARETKEANEFVFADLDIMFNKQKEKAYSCGHYEAFAYLEKLHEHIKTGFAEKLKGELDLIKKMPE